MRIHVDWPWSEDVRNYGAPIRAHIFTKNWNILIGAKSQRWDSEYGWRENEFRFITWSPNRKATCAEPLEDRVVCPRLKEHEGRHWNWKRGWKQSVYQDFSV